MTGIQHSMFSEKRRSAQSHLQAVRRECRVLMPSAVCTERGLAELGEDWRVLYERIRYRNPFMTHEWLEAW